MDYLPPYCVHCWHVGHSEDQCTIKFPELKEQEATRTKLQIQKIVRKVYRPKPTQAQEQRLPALGVDEDQTQSFEPNNPTKEQSVEEDKLDQENLKESEVGMSNSDSGLELLVPPEAQITTPPTKGGIPLGLAADNLEENLS